MTRDNFIKWLKKNDVHYEEYTRHGMDQIYVYSGKEFELKKKHPRKYKDLYIPYLRVSRFFERDNEWYTRENGWTQWMKTKDVRKKILTEYK